MKIGYLGAGTWGTALACLLASNGHHVKVWDINDEILNELDKKRKHPKLINSKIPKEIKYVHSFEEAIEDADIIVESVTSAGIRNAFERIKSFKGENICPIIITSKGIEQNTSKLFTEVFLEIFSEENKNLVGCLGGPTLAVEVAQNLPASVVGAAYSDDLKKKIVELFNTPAFRVYPNSDVVGVGFGGAMKNIIAIACGLSDGLGFGDNTKAALMTRGLHEIRKLSKSKGCKAETLNGLSGLGDLCVTCLSIHSRNYRFGNLLSKGYTIKNAKKEIGMVVEGTYSVVSAMELGKRNSIPIPITEAIYGIIYEQISPNSAVKALLARTIKEEHL